MLRETTLNEARRALILDAARAVFFELGLEGTSLREIAKRAGYTPGAIYNYFNNREEIYAALLSESLERLKEAVDNADSDPAEPAAPALLQARARAFFKFYQDNPQDMDLGFYLFNGAQPRGLTPELNQQLNDQLRATLLPIQEMLVSLGLAEAEAVAETTAIFAHAVGLLMLHHTQRIRLFKQNAQELFEQYLAFLIQRIS
ncbi:MAG: TetR/AcrR family transcriptional regulator [Anaerolineae bacterium]|nr:TetR/AcrR family transcriptional regulator [Anaerolineae bacterium]MCB9108476.1 TetR/AcrR family transcriptional regulator [Anaerolineales bacterium]